MSPLTKYRKLLMLSQKTFGHKAGFCQSTISHYEKRKRTPSIPDARKIITTLNKLGIDCCFDDVFPPDEIA
ncbi:helix-turn-helix transcriptional regulator [Entomomonas asaccharolytica]|uniref:Helix-turn-helix transcriptional regulator n=1 Tax=Entomomonas asaccharolytica TaxID=2785331 RepID=A0A974NEF1_9GAMM|nr:helix-turn-helix transcriptional regulator [Entomomonas asaccharolytica]QQP85094.1 helix-turn-helix transcriptional regulator [Entomomonas asaccharolytica]